MAEANMEAALHKTATKYLEQHAEAFNTVQPSRGVYEQQSPFSSRLLSSAHPPPLVYIDKEKGAAIAFYVLGQELAGHPNILHGGASAALIDEVMGRAAVERLPSRKVAVTVSIDLKYKGPVFLSHKDGEESREWAIVAVCAEVEGVTRRVANVHGWIASLETGDKLVESKAVFVEPKEVCQ
jgi:acyl-coenzyme A thioesterase PaaI-like protein